MEATRVADVAALSAAEPCQQAGEGADFGGRMIWNSFGPRLAEVLAQRLGLLDALGFHSCLSRGTHDPQDVPADVQDFSDPTSPHLRDGTRQLALGDVVARADLRESGSAPTPKGRRRHSPVRSTPSDPGQLAADHRAQHAVDEASPTSTPQQGLGVGRRAPVWRSTVHRVVDGEPRGSSRSRPHRVAEAGDVDASSLSFVDRSASGNSASPPSSRSATTSALVYGTDQAVAAAVDRGDLADGVDVGIACPAGLSASTPPRSASAAPPGQLVARADAAAKITTPHRWTPVAQVHRTVVEPSECSTGFNRFGARADVNRDPEVGDHPSQQRAAGLVDLLGHQPRIISITCVCKPNWRQRISGLVPAARHR